MPTKSNFIVVSINLINELGQTLVKLGFGLTLTLFIYFNLTNGTHFFESYRGLSISKATRTSTTDWQDQFFGTRPRNKTYKNLLRDRDQEIVNAKFFRQDRDETESLGVFFYETETRSIF